MPEPPPPHAAKIQAQLRRLLPDRVLDRLIARELRH
jgi:hypothetical protein